MAVRLGYDQMLLAKVAESLARAVVQDMRRSVKERHGLASVEPLHAGVFTAVQRFCIDAQRRLVAQLVQAGRLSALGEVVAGIAHEIKNPLHALAGTAEIIDPLIPIDADERRLWEIHRKEIARLSRICERFLSFARPGPSELVPLDLRRVAERLVELIQAEAGQKQIRLILDVSADPVTVRA